MSKYLSVKDPNDLFIKDHCIDGKVLVPATAYLLFAWKSLAFHKKVSYKEFAVQFTNVQIFRATPIPNTGKVRLHTNLDERTGRFDIIDSGTVVVSGKVSEITENDLQFKAVFDEIKTIEEKNERNSDKIVFKSKDIYKTLRLRGYNYGPNFRRITQSYEISDKYVSSHISWNDNWITFADCMLQTSILSRKTKQLLVPVAIDLIRCDPKALFKEREKEIEVIYDPNLEIAVTDGLEIKGVRASPLQRNINSTKPLLSSYEFKPFYGQFIYENEENFLVYKTICDELTKKIIDKQKGFSLTGIQSEIIDKIPEESKILYNTLLDLSEDLIHVSDVKHLDKDLMNGCFEDKNFFRSQMTVVLENRSQTKAFKDFEICEVNDSSTSLYSPVINLLQYDLNIEYSLVQSSHRKEQNNYPNVKRFTLIDSSIGQEVSGRDLIIFKDESLDQKKGSDFDLNTLFSSFWQKLDSKGFLLILLKDRQSFAENYIKTKLKLESHEMRRDFVATEALKQGFILVSDISDCFSNHSLLLRKISEELRVGKQIFINFTNDYKLWFEDLRQQLKQIEDKPQETNIWLISKTTTDGLMGFVKCLKREPNGHRIRSLQIMDDKKRSNILDQLNDENQELSEIIKRDLVVNIIKDGSVGHYILSEMSSEPKTVKTKHCFMNLRNRGDLSSFQWFESQHKFWPIGRQNQSLVHIYYSALNFKDIMLATGQSFVSLKTVEN